MQKGLFFLFFILLSSFACAESPDTMESQVSLIEKSWIDTSVDKCKPAIKKNHFLKLIDDIANVIMSFPETAEPLIIKSAILLTMADAANAFEALGLVKKAKKLLDQAIEINPEARDGSALVTMGILYYKVPRWPIGFGDNEKAEIFLLKALKLNAESVTNNYFYADFLLDQGKEEVAVKYLKKAVGLELDEKNISFRIKQRHKEKARVALAKLTQ